MSLRELPPRRPFVPVDVPCDCGHEAIIDRLTAERDALRADLKREKQSHLEDCLKLTYMRDAMEADLTAVVEALRLTHCCATIREDGTCLGCTVSYALARPGIQAILEDK